MLPTRQSHELNAVAELKTPEGIFLIQERRSVERKQPATIAAPANGHTNSPQMMALGGLIILGVLIGSYTTKYDLSIGHTNGPLAVPAIGFLALQLFLARSAYRLFHDVRHIENLGAYVRLRLLRYLPAVIPAVILGFVLIQGGDMPHANLKIETLPANLAMMADMLGVDNVDSSHWRLKIEIFLAVLIGATWFGPMRRYLAAILLFGLAVTAFGVDGEPTRQHSLSLRGLMTADGYLPLFAFGIALFQLIENRSRRIWWVIAAASLILVFCSNTFWHGAIVVASLAVLTAIGLGYFQSLGRIRCLVILGELAFPIYVVHFVAGFVLMHRLEGIGVSPVVALLAASCVAIALGKLVNLAFERPAEAYAPALAAWMGRAFRWRLASGWKRVVDFATMWDATNINGADISIG